MIADAGAPGGPLVRLPSRIRVHAMIVWKGRVLVVERRSSRGVRYGLPGGKIRPGESARDALAREVWEETGAAADVGALVVVWERPWFSRVQPALRTKIGLVFRCAVGDDHLPDAPPLPDPKQTGCRWLPVDAIGGVTLVPRIGGPLVAAIDAAESCGPAWIVLG